MKLERDRFNVDMEMVAVCLYSQNSSDNSGEYCQVRSAVCLLSSIMNKTKKVGVNMQIINLFFCLMGITEFKLLVWVLFILCFVSTSFGFNPVDSYLIDCGSRTNTTVGNRVFVSDNSVSRFLSTPQAILANTTSNSISSGIYRTARIFLNGETKYTLPITEPGRHWIRLHFFAFSFQNYNMSNASFSVSTGRFVLLNNFRPTNGSIMKEFSINITANILVLTFIPTSGSIAFLNALEVVSVPDELISDAYLESVNPVRNFQGSWRQALETVHRVNIGGSLITPQNDTLGMGRTWEADNGFLVEPNLAKPVSNIAAVNYVSGGPTRDIAPDAVYGTLVEMNTAEVANGRFNVTWEFEADPGFQYLVRLHFCDIVSLSLNQLLFNVYIASEVVAQDFDLSTLTTQSLAAPIYKDFVVQKNDAKKLRVSIGPSTDAAGVEPNAILNGLELMKMNNTDGSLAAGTFTGSSIKSKSKTKTALIAGIVAGLLVLMAVATIIVFMMYRRRKREIRTEREKSWVPFSTNNGGVSQSMMSKYSNRTNATTASNFGYRVPFVALQEATDNFNESWVVGVGGFGKVYKGVLRDGTKIAVKRGNPQSQQGLAEFRTEIEMLSQFRHRHLVSLIGYCDERNEMILIYEYMENGTLKSHLYGSEFPTMDWKQRLEICIGSARGLHYLHTGSTKAIIHRDVKSANILLDENLMAKVADFGLSKTGPDIDQTHVSTAVKGSFGYLDPEYFRRQQLTEKSDVYSFGVVLFEVLCARPVIDPSLPREMVNLGEWVMKYQQSGKLEQIIDRHLVGKISPDSLRKFGETAEKCLAEYGVDRPSMADVLWNLEYALQLQEAANQSDPYENSTNQIGDISPLMSNVGLADDSMANAEQFSSIEDLSMSKVFSQLVKAEGR